MQLIDELVSPLLKKGQSISHIYSNHSKELIELNCERRSLYRYLDQDLFTARNIDLPRKVKYKPRKSKNIQKAPNANYRIGRTYEDFKNYLEKNPETFVVEMDTVEGTKGGKILLTLLFRSCSLMLIILLKDKTQESVIQALNNLCNSIGIRRFRKTFPVILTDNGSEFKDVDSIERNAKGVQRCKVFYCDSNCSWQKGMIEKNHELIRYVIPKGKSLDSYTQADITLLMNHINSLSRDSLNGTTPFKLSQLMIDNRLHDKLGLTDIPPDNVTLKPCLLKH